MGDTILFSTAPGNSRVTGLLYTVCAHKLRIMRHYVSAVTHVHRTVLSANRRSMMEYEQRRQYDKVTHVTSCSNDRCVTAKRTVTGSEERNGVLTAALVSSHRFHYVRARPTAARDESILTHQQPSL